MIWMIVITVILLALLIGSCFCIVKFGTIILEVQEIIEESINDLDNRQASITKILQTPLFYDSPEVRGFCMTLKLPDDQC